MSTSAAVLLLAGTPAHAATAVPVVTGRFTPIDNCNRQPGAAAFLSALTGSVRARNLNAFLALTTPDVRLDFGDGAGHAELRRRLAGENGRKLWRELDRILPLGCAVQSGNLTMPGVFARDFGDTDPFDTMVVTGARVPLLARPVGTSRPLRLLSWTLVEPLSGDDFEKPFRQVRLPGGKVVGYVETTKLRSPLDYRLVASRRGGAWKIDAFVAGD